MSVPAFQIDFRRQPRSRWRWAGWAFLGLAVVVVLGVSERASVASQRRDVAGLRHERLAERLRTQAPRRETAAADPKVMADVQRANRIIDQLTVPWHALFEAVESADSRGLALMSLTPNAVDRSLRLAGEARDMSDLLAYVTRLAAQPSLQQVHLLSYKTQPRDGVSVVSFTVAGRWRQAP